MKKLRTHRSSESTGQKHKMEWEKPWCKSRHSPALWASSDKRAMKRKGEQGRWRVSGKWCPRQLSTHVRKMDRVCVGCVPGPYCLAYQVGEPQMMRELFIPEWECFVSLLRLRMRFGAGYVGSCVSGSKYNRLQVSRYCVLHRCISFNLIWWFQEACGW